MKRTIHPLYSILLALGLFSCVAQRHTESYLNIYQDAIQKYEKKDYYEARKRLQEAIPLLKGKKEIISAQFYLAQCFFHEKKYSESAHYFKEFYKTYPKVAQAEETLYMQGYSMYLNSPDIRLDSAKTEKATKILRKYTSQYPKGNYKQQVQQYIQELQDRLALKEFKNAELYYKLGHYQAAVRVLNNLQDSYPGNVYSEEANYIKIKAQYEVAEKATVKKQLENWKRVIHYYNELLDQYPNSQYAKKVQAIYEQALHKVDQLINYSGQE